MARAKDRSQPMSGATGDRLRARLESLGAAQVRTMLQSGGFPTQDHVSIVEWLAEKDQEERRRNDASQTEMSQTARSAKNAAWIAAIAAIAAAIMAIVSVVMALS